MTEMMQDNSVEREKINSNSSGGCKYLEGHYSLN